MDLEEIIFEPSGKVYDFIGYLEGKGHRSYNLVLPLMEKNAYRFALAAQIAAYYHKNAVSERIMHVAQLVHSLFGEVIRNGMVHGSQKGVMIGLFLGEKGFCFGAQDFGDYFKNKEVKRKWENREPISSSGVKKKVGLWTAEGGAGIGMIYGVTDLIEVDSQRGILYCATLHDRYL